MAHSRFISCRTECRRAANESLCPLAPLGQRRDPGQVDCAIAGQISAAQKNPQSNAAGEVNALSGSLPFRFELFAADDLQCREVSLGQLPHDGRSDAFVLVSQYVADPCHLSPRNVRMASFQLIGQMPACLGNNLDTTFDKPLRLPVGLEKPQVAYRPAPNERAQWPQ